MLSVTSARVRSTGGREVNLLTVTITVPDTPSGH